MKAPAKLYLELWPEGLEHRNAVHYEPTGYGIDMASGETSRIIEYERVRAKATKKKRQAGRKGKG